MVEKASPRLHRADSFGQHPHADAEHLFPSNDADTVHDFVERGAHRNDGGDHGLDFTGAGQGIEEAPVQHRIQHTRAGAQLLGQARGGSQNGCDEIKQVGVGLQHGKKLNPGGQARR